jgi:nitroreductase
MQKRICAAVLAAAALGIFPLFAQQSADPAGVIFNHYAAGSFVAGPIPKADLERIVQAGIRAPSARNRQPWHFTVVQNQDLAKKMVPQTVAGNVLIVVSANGDGKTNGGEILDCALAVESIYLAAQALGYGSRIYTGPMDSLNRNLKNDLELPRGYNAVALIRVGKIEAPADATSAASSRRAANTMVTYK